MIPQHLRDLLQAKPNTLQSVEEILVLAVLLDYEISFFAWLRKGSTEEYDKITIRDSNKIISITFVHCDNKLDKIYISISTSNMNTLRLSNLRKLKLVKEAL